MPTLEQRVSELENQIRQVLEREKRTEPIGTEPWWKRHSGAFENNRLYDEAMRLGSEYRRAQPTPADSPEEFTD
jgi:hypothetical protein